jgi:hypothetical protein
MEQEIREMDCRVLAEYAYPDDPAYNYVVRQFGLDGEWYLPYEAEVNSGSGIGADYMQFASDDLDELLVEVKDYLQSLIDLDFTEPVLVLTEYHGEYVVEYENSNGVLIANILHSDESLVDAIAERNLETLQQKIKQYFEENK